MPSKKALIAAGCITLGVVGLVVVLRKFAPTILDITRIGGQAAVDITRRSLYGETRADAMDANDARRTA